MGFTIGQFSGGGSVLRSVRDAQSSRVPRTIEPALQPVPGKRDESLSTLFRAPPSPPVKVGFGEGAIAGAPAAALIALNGTVQNVQANTPTLEDIRAEFRQRAEEARSRIQVQFQVGELDSEDAQPPEDVPRAEPAQFAANDASQTPAPQFDSPGETDDNGVDRPIQENERPEPDDAGRPAPFDVTA